MSKQSTPYDGFNIVGLVERMRQENLEAEHKGLPLPRSLFKTFIPLEWQKEERRWFTVTEISKCLRLAGYKALGEKGLPPTLQGELKKQKGTFDHYRLEREFRLTFLARELTIFDPEAGIYGRCDGLPRNYITGELFPVDFKTIEEWLFKTRITRKNLPVHLRKTPFYVPLPDDELQVMLYIRMLRQLIYPLEISLRFGMVIYENKNDPSQKKSCLVEYSEELIIKFLARLQELNACLDRGENIPPYIVKEAYVHNICPFRLQCPRGQESQLLKGKKKNIPLWKILELKRRGRQEMPPPSPPPQLKLNIGER